AASNHDDFGLRLTKDGVPVIYGAETTMRAMANMLRHRDLRARPAEPLPETAAADLVAKWRTALASVDPDEATALTMLAEFGLPAVETRIVEDVDGAIAAADALGYPVVLKTAVAGIAHKSDMGGVKLNLEDQAAVWEAYRDLKARLGTRVLVAPMAGSGCELILGGLVDPKFGPAVVIGAGGIHAEILRESRCLLAPFGPATARRALDSLAVAPILAGARGRPPLAVEATAQALSRFSAMLAGMADSIAEIDVNPLLVTETGCLALDGLVLPRA
ncbi:MAG: acetate--CoA ligase family protein, partial [Rhodospirillaceae bacterium]|nr:acetate--CoA ligase family protein [Rhodospirillaceae bacterium]